MISNFRIEFSRPWFLLLLIPALFVTLFPYFRLAKKFRRNRNRVISTVTHAVAMTLCITLIAGITFSYDVPNRENELLVLVDLSDSSKEKEEAKGEFLQSVVNACDKNTKVGIVSFGTNTVYAAPLSYDSREVYRQYLAAKRPDTSATDIASAIDFASSQFENPKSAKILLLSDGIETDGTALSAVKIAAAKGIKVDVAQFSKEQHSEMQIIGVKMPEDKVIVGQEVKITLTVETNLKEETEVQISLSDKGFSSGSVRVKLKGGVESFEVAHTFQSAGMHDMIFSLDPIGDVDTVGENNVYHSYFNIPVFDNVLILENIPGEADTLAALLGEDRGNVKVVNIHSESELVPKSARELSAYEEVVLVNMANSDLTGIDMPPNFVEALYDYVYHLGGGLFTVGGKNDLGPDGLTQVPHAYNRADIADSLFSQMLPVDVIDYTPPTAVMIVVDASGSMSEGRYEAALRAAREIAGALTARDYCGVMTFSDTTKEEIDVIPVAQRERIYQTIDALKQVGGGGGTVFRGAINAAGGALAPLPVERRHIVLITDGNPSDDLEEESASDENAFGKYIDYNYNIRNITMSVFTVGRTSSLEAMQKTAERGHGTLYDVPLGELDKITTYARQDLAAAQIAELNEGLKATPKIKDQSSVLVGIDSTMKIPYLSGYYGTKLKEGAKAPLFYEYVPIYAEWNFGAGRVGSFLSDLGGAWSQEFVTDEVGIRLIKNISESLAPSEEIEPDRLQITVKEEKDNYTYRLNVYTSLGEGETIVLKVKPESADAAAAYFDGVPVTPLGDNVGFTFRLTVGGVYRVTVEKQDAEGNVTASRSLLETFSYSAEYLEFLPEEQGTKFLASLAEDGNGEVQTDPVGVYAGFAKVYAVVTDPRLVFLILAILCVLADVAVRKFKFKWIHEIVRDRKREKEMTKENGTTEN